jgi:LmbE family N-acetylglucosaminyl deacetylase
MLRLALPAGPLKVLCLGAHADDIEIGCAGTLLRLMAERPDMVVRWVVFGADGGRSAEARNSAEALLASVNKTVDVLNFRDGYFPFHGAGIKDRFEALKRDFEPSLVFTHWRQDAHQDHGLVGSLTRQTFRDHLILEYEIPKSDGDLGNPNVLVPLTRAQFRRKADHLLAQFPSQAQRAWFTTETFMALARLRGIACNAPEGLAEGFYATKIVL